MWAGVMSGEDNLSMFRHMKPSVLTGPKQALAHGARDTVVQTHFSETGVLLPLPLLLLLLPGRNTRSDGNTDALTQEQLGEPHLGRFNFRSFLHRIDSLSPWPSAGRATRAQISLQNQSPHPWCGKREEL